MNDIAKQTDLVTSAFNFLIVLNGHTTTLDVKNFLHTNGFPMKQHEVRELVYKQFDYGLLIKSMRELVTEKNVTFYRYYKIDKTSDNTDSIQDTDPIVSKKTSVSDFNVKLYKEDLSGLTSEEVEDLALADNTWVCRCKNNFDNFVYAYDGGLLEYQARGKYVVDSGFHKDSVRRMRLKNYISKLKRKEDN